MRSVACRELCLDLKDSSLLTLERGLVTEIEEVVGTDELLLSSDKLLVD